MSYRITSEFTMERDGREYDITLTEMTIADSNRIRAKEKNSGEPTPLWEIFPLMDGRIKHAGTDTVVELDNLGIGFIRDVYEDYNDFLAKKRKK